MRAQFKDVRITGTFRSIEPSPWGRGDRPKYLITLTRDGTTTKFIFWGAIKDTEDGELELSEHDLLFAFHCFLSDAWEGSEGFDEFRSNMGNNVDDTHARNIYRACKRQREKAEKLLGNEWGRYHEELLELDL